MGYILPVTQHQYINYANRILKDKKHPYHTISLSKVRLTSHDLANNMQSFQQLKQKNITLNDKDGFEKIYTQLTGKGKSLDIRV